MWNSKSITEGPSISTSARSALSSRAARRKSRAYSSAVHTPHLLRLIACPTWKRRPNGANNRPSSPTAPTPGLRPLHQLAILRQGEHQLATAGTQCLGQAPLGLVVALPRMQTQQHVVDAEVADGFEQRLLIAPRAERDSQWRQHSLYGRLGLELPIARARMRGAAIAAALRARKWLGASNTLTLSFSSRPACWCGWSERRSPDHLVARTGIGIRGGNVSMGRAARQQHVLQRAKAATHALLGAVLGPKTVVIESEQGASRQPEPADSALAANSRREIAGGPGNGRSACG